MYVVLNCLKSILIEASRQISLNLLIRLEYNFVVLNKIVHLYIMQNNTFIDRDEKC